MGLGDKRVSEGTKLDVPDPVTQVGAWPTDEERAEEESKKEHRTCCFFFSVTVPTEEEHGKGSVESTTCRRALWLTFLRTPMVLFCCF